MLKTFKCALLVLVQCIWFSESTNPCLTPNGEHGQCEHLLSCSVLKDAYEQEPSVEKFIEASACGTTKFTVCCGTSTNFTQNSKNEEVTTELEEDGEAEKWRKRVHSLIHLLPNKTYCGKQHWDDYQHYGNETMVSVDEFPWVLDFHDPKGYKQCSAVLISSRYALTLDHCAESQEVALVIGQHDKDRNVSCIATNVGVDDCTYPKLTVNIEEKIRLADSKLILIRLSELITYTDYIRPICLPFDESDVPKIRDKVFTSGWGIYWPKGEEWRRVFKFKTQCIVEGYGRCGVLTIYYGSRFAIKNPFYLYFNQEDLPLRGKPGPVMYKNRSMNWFLEGFIVIAPSHGDTLSACAEQITPSVVNWILENMRD